MSKKAIGKAAVEAGMTPEQAFQWACVELLNKGKWPRQRYRVEGATCGQSRLLSRGKARETARFHHGEVVELIPRFSEAAFRVLQEIGEKDGEAARPSRPRPWLFQPMCDDEITSAQDWLREGCYRKGCRVAANAIERNGSCICTYDRLLETARRLVVTLVSGESNAVVRLEDELRISESEVDRCYSEIGSLESEIGDLKTGVRELKKRIKELEAPA